MMMIRDGNFDDREDDSGHGADRVVDGVDDDDDDDENIGCFVLKNLYNVIMLKTIFGNDFNSRIYLFPAIK